MLSPITFWFWLGCMVFTEVHKPSKFYTFQKLHKYNEQKPQSMCSILLMNWKSPHWETLNVPQ